MGVAERSKLITPAHVKAGDVLLGLPSSGVHSNGYSLVRKIVFERKGFKGDEYIEELGQTIGEELLTPTRLYPRICLPLIREFDIHGMVHITGGGFYENIPRILGKGQGIEIKEGSWEISPVFRFLERYGNVPHDEMFNIFNMGIGMVVAMSADEADEAIAILEKHGEKATVIGKVTDKEGVKIS